MALAVQVQMSLEPNRRIEFEQTDRYLNFERSLTLPKKTNFPELFRWWPAILSQASLRQ